MVNLLVNFNQVQKRPALSRSERWSIRACTSALMLGAGNIWNTCTQTTYKTIPPMQFNIFSFGILGDLLLLRGRTRSIPFRGDHR